jgi:hypothetical protein
MLTPSEETKTSMNPENSISMAFFKRIAKSLSSCICDKKISCLFIKNPFEVEMKKVSPVRNMLNQ